MEMKCQIPFLTRVFATLDLTRHNKYKYNYLFLPIRLQIRSYMNFNKGVLQLHKLKSLREIACQEKQNYSKSLENNWWALEGEQIWNCIGSPSLCKTQFLRSLNKFAINLPGYNLIGGTSDTRMDIKSAILNIWIVPYPCSSASRTCGILNWEAFFFKLRTKKCWIDDKMITRTTAGHRGVNMLSFCLLFLSNNF